MTDELELTIGALRAVQAEVAGGMHKQGSTARAVLHEADRMLGKIIADHEVRRAQDALDLVEWIRTHETGGEVTDFIIRHATVGVVESDIYNYLLTATGAGVPVEVWVRVGERPES